MIENQARTCGRLTKSGRPCKVRVHGPDVACGIHATEQDRAVAEAYRRGYEEGRESGARYSKESSKIQIASLEREVKELRQRLLTWLTVRCSSGEQCADLR